MFTLSFLPHIKWSDLPANVQAAICALCQRSPLLHLRVDGAGTINSVTEFSHLVASPALKILSLKDLDIPVPGPDEIPPTHTVALTDLELDSNSPTLTILPPWLVDGGSLSQTISISCPCTPETIEHIHALTHAAPATLESFARNCSYDPRPAGWPSTKAAQSRCPAGGRRQPLQSYRPMAGRVAGLVPREPEALRRRCLSVRQRSEPSGGNGLGSGGRGGHHRPLSGP
ncbi:hypothetical protein B0H16DRAFT_1542850 [Mycena metata]|uniref:Uncharacterized protein n=1 Tax=Mycena metata TaxID=1033252 RepID=A0AAD7J113_9AGAR|nr:hypothetical protein B0H16DRAFT_1542850 [Mycena metata]